MLKRILIVNPTSSVEYLARSFKSRDFKVYAIFNHDLLANNLPHYDEFMHKINSTFDTIFDEIFTFATTNIALIVSQLEKLKLDYILNGSEYSTSLSDQLGYILTPNFANNPKTSKFRQNKFLTIEQAKNLSSILTPAQKLVNRKELTDHNYLKSCVANFKWPIFCKPDDGRGSIGVFKAESFDQLINQLQQRKIMNDYIFQEFIDGVEYFVDVVSIQGQHIVAAVGKYTKQYMNDTPVYRSSELVNDKKIVLKIELAVNELLNAIDCKNGFNHIEIIITQDIKIYLVEVNNRISGGNGSNCFMENHVGLKSQDVILAEYLHNTNQMLYQPPWQFKGTVCAVDLYKFNPGYLENIEEILAAHKLKTMVKYFEGLVSGSYIQKLNFISILDSIGCVILFDLDRNNVLHDIKTIQ
ncbi:MAG: ATP-grasp domain-containing protein, partial [Burkholderiales bacterium]|nr:ATP-grasp domain-containing protein [Burkholderiales bacterium]